MKREKSLFRSNDSSSLYQGSLWNSVQSKYPNCLWIFKNKMSIILIVFIFIFIGFDLWSRHGTQTPMKTEVKNSFGVKLKYPDSPRYKQKLAPKSSAEVSQEMDKMLPGGSNVDLSDLSVSQGKFSRLVKTALPANTTDNKCNKHLLPMIQDRFPVLTDNFMPLSDLWIDRPDAHTILLQKYKNKIINKIEARNLQFFLENGYLFLDFLYINLQTYEIIDQFYDFVWKNRPSNLLVMHPQSSNFTPTPFHFLPKDLKEVHGFKMMNAHAHNPALLLLVLNKKIHHYLSLIYEDIPVATQSYLFRLGSSSQFFHRDPWYLPNASPPGNMISSWLALEDISIGSGELHLIPGSHRIPYKPFNNKTKEILFQHAPNNQSILEHIDDMWNQVKKNKLRRKRITLKKGQVLLLHANLIHGGGPITDDKKTRKSLVTHYDFLKKSGRGVDVFDGGKKMKKNTKKLLRHNCLYAFTDPMVN